MSCRCGGRSALPSGGSSTPGKDGEAHGSRSPVGHPDRLPDVATRLRPHRGGSPPRRASPGSSTASSAPGASARRRARTCSHPRRRRGERGRDRAPRVGRRLPRPGRGRPGARPCARAGPGARGCLALAARAARRPAHRGGGARGALAEPGPRTAESEPTFDPQDTMAFDPIAEDEVAAQAAPPAPGQLRFGRDVPATDHRTGWLTQTPVAAPAWSTPRRPSRPARRRARAPGSSRSQHGRRRPAPRGHRRLPRRPYPAAERAALLDEIYRGRARRSSITA